jgi:hypothetical protein
MLKKYILISIITLLFLSPIKAQTSDTIPSSTPKNKLTTKQKVIITGLAAEQLINLYLEYRWWWEGNYHALVINNDGGFNNYSLGLDKVGHFYTSYVYFQTLNELMRWGDFSTKSRLIVSTATPILWALSIEIGDGFSTYEFSPADLGANMLGLSYGLLQDQIPYLKNFTFKFSYFPTSYYIKNNFKGWSPSADYSGHLYWLSFNIHHLLPKNAGKHWPEFLNLAVGYGIENYGIQFKEPLQRTFVIGIDWNLSAIKTKNKTQYAIKELLNYYHFPAPAVKKTEGEPAEFKPLLLR